MKNCLTVPAALTRLFADENFLLYSIVLQCYSVYVTLIGSTGFTVDKFKVQQLIGTLTIYEIVFSAENIEMKSPITEFNLKSNCRLTFYGKIYFGNELHMKTKDDFSKKLRDYFSPSRIKL